MPLHNARTRRQTRRRTTRRPLTSRRRKGGKKSEEDRLVDDFRKELQRLHKSHNPKDKKTFCSKLKAYAQVVQLDGKTNELQAAQKLRKMASRAVRQEWNDSALKPNKAPLDAICEAIWNDTSKDGEAFFDKKRGRGWLGFVASSATFAGINFITVITGLYLGGSITEDSGAWIGGLSGFLTGIAGSAAIDRKLFTTEEGISKNIRKHLTRKAKRRRNTPSE